MSAQVFSVTDPEAAVTFPVTDGTGQNVDWADPTVTAGDVEIAAQWQGAPSPTRDLRIPLDNLPVGSYYLWLSIPNTNDLLLGEVSIINPLSAPVSQPTDCLWPLDPACLGDTWDGFSAAVRLRAQRLASQTLGMLTAGRVGVCAITVRPNMERGGCWLPTGGSIYGYSVAPFLPLNLGGTWINVGGRYSHNEVELPAPVGRIDEVQVDGVVIDPADYRVDNSRYLVWQGEGPAPWPRSQDMSVRDGDVGSFSVTYLNAHPVDASGAHAAGLLAVEFGKACSGAGKCALPKGVVSIVRQGVSMEIRPGNFPDGFTGIREVDAYIARWNPNALKMQPKVWSPDLPQHRMTTLGG